MVWAKLDDEILDNEKIVRAGIFGFAIHVAAITWCCRNLTDGRIPVAKVCSLLMLDRVNVDSANPLALIDGPRSMGGSEGLDACGVADHLVAVGLWHEVPGGYEINDFLDYNPSREEVLAKRAKEALKKQRSRAAASMSPATSATSPRGTPIGNLTSPDPDPDPDPFEPSSEGSQTRARTLHGSVQINQPLTDDVRGVWATRTETRDPGRPIEDVWADFCGHYATQTFGNRDAMLGKWSKWIGKECLIADKARLEAADRRAAKWTKNASGPEPAKVPTVEQSKAMAAEIGRRLAAMNARRGGGQ